MTEFKASINKIPTKSEFNSREMGMLDTLIADNAELIKSDNIGTFVEQVGSKGHTFCPSTFKKGVKSRETFDQSQLLPLYFNSKEASFEEIKIRTEQYGLQPLFAYDTFSLGTRKRFSFVFLNETPFYDPKEAEAAQKALMMIFPEADKSCGNISKLYSGGNKLLHFDDTVPEINVDSLFMNMSLYLRNRYGATNYKRKIAEFSKITGVALNDKKLPAISVVENSAESIIENTNNKNSPSPIMLLHESGEKLSKMKYLINFEEDKSRNGIPSNNKKPSIHRSYRSDVLKTLSSSCNLYQEFESGNRMLSQCELLGLATNLAQVESGEAKFKTSLSVNSYFKGQKEKYDNWDYYLYYIKGQNPRPCTSFCPHHVTCPHGNNILSTSKPKRNQIERIANLDALLVDLDEAWNDFMEKFNKAVLSDERIWHVISSQTALGKTEAILKLLKDTPLRVLVAVPTNKLKREVYERAKEMGIDIIVSPSLHELEDDLPDDVWDDIETLYDAGKSPMPRLNKAIAEDDLECAGLFKQYKRELDEFTNSDGHAITTHRRLASVDVRKYDLVIIDEDIIYSTVIPSRDNVPISKLEKLKMKLAASGSLAAKINKILKLIKKDEFFTLKEIDYDRAYADIKMAVNIPALCSATYFCYRKASGWESDLEEDCVSFIKPVKFQEDTKYIMLSATADKAVCEYCFSEGNVKFYTCKEAKKGIIITYHDGKKKKKIRLTAYPGLIVGDDPNDLWKPSDDNISTLSDTIEKLIDSYFYKDYGLDDFKLSRVEFSADLDVGSSSKVSDYIKILHNIGRVKCFSPLKRDDDGEKFNKEQCFALKGNSNGVEFRAGQLNGRKNILRVVVRLNKADTICLCSGDTDVSEQIKILAKKSESIFMDTFRYIIPPGVHYKKPKAEKLVRERVSDWKMRSRMVHLLMLIPEKKSLHLAIKSLNYRSIGDVIDAFAKINVCPVTISKRHEVKHLQSLYNFL